MTTADSTGDDPSDAPLLERAFGGALVVDVAATRAARADFTRGGAEACGCADCRAWLAVRDDVLSTTLRAWIAGAGLEDGCEAAVHPLEDDDGPGVELVFHLLGSLRDDEPIEVRDALPDALLALRVRPGTELAPAAWPTDRPSVELALLLDVPEPD